MKIIQNFVALNCAIIMSVSVMGFSASATTIEKDYNNNRTFQTQSYTERGSSSTLVCGPYIARLKSTAADYNNAGKSVAYTTYADAAGKGTQLEYKNNYCFDGDCTVAISTDALDSGTLANVGCRKYIARLHNTSSISSEFVDTYKILIHKRAVYK